MSVQERIKQMVSDTPVVLFMKGSRRMPQCGFSAGVVQMLDQYLDEYETVNVLMDQDIRQGIKDFANWPTIPQLYVAGEFVGGHDIIVDLEAQGELPKILGKVGTIADVEPPTIEITDKAAESIKGASEAEAESGQVLRFEVDGQWRYAMYFDAPRPADFRLEVNGLSLAIDRASAKKADGVKIDFAVGAQGEGFKISNPNEPPVVRGIVPEDLKSMMDAGEEFQLIDVREDDEIATAKLPGSIKLDDEAKKLLADLSKTDATIVLYCHHGRRSEVAAQALVDQGFRKVLNLVGGIDAWSMKVDPKLPRY